MGAIMFGAYRDQLTDDACNYRKILHNRENDFNYQLIRQVLSMP